MDLFGFKKRAIKREAAINSRIQERADQLVGVNIQNIKNQLGYSITPDRGQSGGAKFPNGLSNSGRIRFFNHRLLRRNARDAYSETPEAMSLVNRFAETVADIGLMLEAAPKSEILGISIEEAERWAKNVEDRFDSWARDKKQNRSETMTFYQSHKLYQIFQHRDNDIFVRLYYSGDRSLQNPLQFEFIDPDQIRSDAFTTTAGIQSYQDGIQRDERGREKSYKVWIPNKAKPGDYNEVNIPRVGPKSKRLFMLHGFDPVYAGQGRGFSRLSFALQEFQNLTDLSLAHIKKAIAQSNLSMFVKPGADNPATNPFSGILHTEGAGPKVNELTDPPTSEEIEETGLPLPAVGYTPLPEATLAVPGDVGVFNLNEGESLEPFKMTAPADSYATFVESFVGNISAAAGMPREVLLMKFGENYSASRATLILFWRVANIWREEMAADYLNPVFSMWLAEEIAAGRIMAPGFTDPILRAAWLNNRWIGAPMPNIDPKRTADADKTYAELGAHTLDRIARNLNGSDGQKNRAKLSREFKELSLAPWNMKPETPGTAAAVTWDELTALVKRIEDIEDNLED